MHLVILGSIKSNHVVKWANALVKRDYRVDIITMHESREILDPKINVIKLKYPNPFGYILNILEVKRIIKSLNPDITHSFYAFGYGFLGRMSNHKAFVLSVMGSDVYDDIKKSWLYRRIITKNLGSATILCSTSRVMKEQVKKLLKKDREIEITPFGVDVSLFKPENTKLVEKSDFFVVGTVKLLEDKYGVDILIRAFSKLSEYLPESNIRLDIIGDGSKKSELEEIVSKLNLTEKVQFLGYYHNTEIPRFLNSFDVYVALSRLDSESFGVAILEASSCELPVIVSNVGGLVEVIKDFETGLIVPNEDIDAAFRAMLNLYQDKELRRRLGKTGRLNVINQYSWKYSVDRMEEIYAKAIQVSLN